MPGKAKKHLGFGICGGGVLSVWVGSTGRQGAWGGGKEGRSGEER
jgi:hypothetical protein